MRSKPLNFTIFFLFCFLIFREDSYGSEKKVSDFYESILKRDSLTLSQYLSDEAKSSPTSFEEWFKTIEKTLISFSFSYKKENQKMILSSDRTSKEVDSSKSLQSAFLDLLLVSSNYGQKCAKHYPSFCEACTQISPSTLLYGSKEISSYLDRMIYLISSLSK